jgi:hypothetical protein
MARHKQPKPIHQLTSAQFDKLFPDEDACRVYLVARRWPEGVSCPRCGSGHVYELKTMAFNGNAWTAERASPIDSPSLPGRFSRTPTNRFAIGIASFT